LTAVTQPLAAPTRLAPMPPQDPLSQQINFHIAFVGDFLATGAALFTREFAIPSALLQDIQHGTSIPDALARALVDFAQVELDAGRELVRFAVQYVHFQIGFVANILRDVITFVMAIPTAVGAVFAGLTPQPITEPSVPTPMLSTSATRSSQTPGADPRDTSTSRNAVEASSSSDDDARKGEHSTEAAAAPATATPSATANEPKEIAAVQDPVKPATVSAQGEVKTAPTEPGRTNRTTAGEPTSEDHQTATPELPSKHDATHDAADRKDAAPPSKRDDSVR
jgi:hypothetical protein